jgi:hypothetical protein
MRGRAAFLFLLLLAPTAFPQCNYSRVATVPFRTTAYDVALDGNDLWLASGYGVSLYDRSVDPPKLTAFVAVPQTTKVVRASNGTAYAGSGDTIAVVRKSGRQLQLASTVAAPGVVNDLLLTPNYLYAATKNGIAQYALFDSIPPAKTLATFPTSSANVTSLALAGSFLYAADGDSSVESFDLNSPQSPQPRSSITSLPRAATLHVVNSRLYVSDGLQTETFLQPAGTPSSTAVNVIATTSAAPIVGDALFAAGSDRRLRAFDLSVAATPIEIYRNDTPASGGNVNRILSMAAAGGRLYVAAGDGGLVTYDISGFTAPFALRSYTTSSAPSSVVSLGDHVYFAPAAGGIVEYTQLPTGALTQGRTWDASHADVVRDGANGFLLSTSGANATLWTLASTIPVSISDTTFSASVVRAALFGTTAVALLADGSVATADMSNIHPTPQKVTIAGASKLGGMARSGNALVFVQDNGDGTSTLFYFANASSLATLAATANVDGIPVGGVALGGSTAAVFTFKGINVVDFSASPAAVRTLTKSNSVAPLQLAFSGPSLLELTPSELVVWSTANGGAVTARYTLPSSGVVLTAGEGSAIADIVTGSGISTVALASTSRLPSPFSSPNGNDFYKKIAAGGNRIYLLAGQVDILTSALGFVGNTGGGIIDVAANGKGFFTVNGAALVTAWSAEGVALKTATVLSGGDVQPLAIFTAGNALWVSFSRGCLSGGCEKVTLILDPVTLAQSDQLTGGVTDVAVSGTRAYALTDFPREIRVYDITKPRPSRPDRLPPDHRHERARLHRRRRRERLHARREAGHVHRRVADARGHAARHLYRRRRRKRLRGPASARRGALHARRRPQRQRDLRHLESRRLDGRRSVRRSVIRPLRRVRPWHVLPAHRSLDRGALHIAASQAAEAACGGTVDLRFIPGEARDLAARARCSFARLILRFARDKLRSPCRSSKSAPRRTRTASRCPIRRCTSSTSRCSKSCATRWRRSNPTATA